MRSRQDFGARQSGAAAVPSFLPSRLPFFVHGLALALLAALLVACAIGGRWWTWLGLPLLGVLVWPPRAASAQPTAMPALLPRLLPIWSRQLEVAGGNVQQGTTALLDSFSQMLALQAELEQLGASADASAWSALSAQAEQALHGLQFGDRVQQMLVALKDDVDRLQACGDELMRLSPAQIEAWLAELEARYTTQEQRESHAEGGAPGKRVDSVDFF